MGQKAFEPVRDALPNTVELPGKWCIAACTAPRVLELVAEVRIAILGIAALARHYLIYLLNKINQNQIEHGESTWNGPASPDEWDEDSLLRAVWTPRHVGGRQ